MRLLRDAVKERWGRREERPGLERTDLDEGRGIEERGIILYPRSRAGISNLHVFGEMRRAGGWCNSRRNKPEAMEESAARKEGMHVIGGVWRTGCSAARYQRQVLVPCASRIQGKRGSDERRERSDSQRVAGPYRCWDVASRAQAHDTSALQQAMVIVAL